MSDSDRSIRDFSIAELPAAIRERSERTSEARAELLARWIEYIDTLTWHKKQSANDKGTFHHSSYLAFLRAGSLGIDATTAIAEVIARIVAAGGSAQEEKRRGQWQWALSYIGENPHAFESASIFYPKITTSVYQPKKLGSVASKLGLDHIDDDYFIARSPYTTWNRNPAGFLHKLFREGERVVVFDVFKSQGCALWQCPGLTGNFATLDFLASGHESVWFLCNPVDGEWREIERLKSEYNPSGRTRRAEENVTSFRYAVIESDEAPRDLWLKALARLPLPIASVVDSGGSSIHALFRIDAENKAHWDELVSTTYKRPLVTLGADPGAMTAVRLTRLANCFRGEKNTLQRLLYLNDQSDETPICERPVLRKVTL
jgi:hypothetical protein